MQLERARLLVLMQSVLFICFLLLPVGLLFIKEPIQNLIYRCTFHVASGTAFIIDQESDAYERSPPTQNGSLLLMIECRVNKGRRTRSEGPITPQQVLSVQQIAGTALQVALLHICFCSRLLLSGLFLSAAAERL